MSDLFTCTVQPCGFSAPADRMWNLDRKDTKGDLVILCGRDAHAARKHGLRTYRLADTFRRDAERREAEAKRTEFFNRFANARLSDAFGRRNGNSSRPEVKVE